MESAGTVQTRGHRTLRLEAVSAIELKPIKWLWDGHLPLGTIALLGGREGIGKSTLAYDLAAQITRGELPGEYFHTPKGVIVAATEDPWEQVIAPRLKAAGADLNRVFRVDVAIDENIPGSLSLPVDIPALGEEMGKKEAVLVLLDPLLSRLDARLDTHKDAEVRRALEPLVALADRTESVVLGLIHVNKGASTDPLTQLMASRAFTAVARAVLYMMVDPDDPNVRLVGQEKNNLGRMDLPTLTLTIVQEKVGQTAEGREIFASRISWLGETDRRIREMIAMVGRPEDRTKIDEAADWLEDYVAQNAGSVDSADAKKEGSKAGHSERNLKRAMDRAGIGAESYGFPRRTRWVRSDDGGDKAGERMEKLREMDRILNPDDSRDNSLGRVTTVPTSPTGYSRDSRDSRDSQTVTGNVVPTEAEHVLCADSQAHYASIRRSGDGWTCDVCTPTHAI